MNGRSRTTGIVLGVMLGVLGVSGCAADMSETGQPVQESSEVQGSSSAKDEAETAEQEALPAPEEAAPVDAPTAEEDVSDPQWMWVDETQLRDQSDMYYTDSELFDEETSVENLIEGLHPVDWDNDGEWEYAYFGDIRFPGIFFDLVDGELVAVSGYGPYSMGWNGVVERDGAYWVYEASGNTGRMYEFYRYDRDHVITDRLYYEMDFGEDPEAGDYTYYAGKDPENMSEITEEEFLLACGDEAFQELPSPGEGEASEEMLTQIVEFYHGERPLIALD